MKLTVFTDDIRSNTMEDEILTVPETAEVVDIQFRAGQKVYYFDPAGHLC